MLEYNKNYAILVFNCMLKNLEKIILVLGTYRRNRNKNIIVEKNT